MQISLPIRVLRGREKPFPARTITTNPVTPPTPNDLLCDSLEQSPPASHPLVGEGSPLDLFLLPLPTRRATVSSCKNKIGFFEQILQVNQKLSHGSYDDAFVGLATSSESIDIGLDMFVVNGGAGGCQVEAFSYFSSSTFDFALTLEQAAITVIGSQPHQSDEQVAIELGDLTEVCKEGRAGDFTHASDLAHDLLLFTHELIVCDQITDALIDALEFFFK
jgi:hypothetical protein